MQGHDFIFFITDDSGLFYGLDRSGSLSITANPYPLKFSPFGWDDITILNERNRRLWGVDRSLSVPLSYVEDGAAILKQVVYKYGHERNLNLIICRQQLDYQSAPAGTIAFTAGQSPLSSGSSTLGTLTATPNSTIYVTVTLEDAAGSDSVVGNIGGGSFVNLSTSTTSQTYEILVPATGVVNFNVFYNNASGGSSCTLQLTNTDGSTSASYGFWYKMTYKGAMDLTTFNHTGAKVTCTLLEEGLPKYLRANENTVYELPMDVPEVKYVKMDGIRLKEKLTYESLGSLSASILGYGVSMFEPLNKIANEGDSVGLLIDSPIIESTAGIAWADKLQSQNAIITNASDTAITFTITGRVEFQCTGMTSAPAYACRVRFLRSNQLIGNQNDYAIIATTAMTVGQIYGEDINLTITLDPGERLYREIVFFGGTGSDAVIEFTANSQTFISFITRHRTTYIKAFTGQYLLDQLAHKVTDGKFSGGLSTFLSQNADKLFTCGNAIRGLVDAKMNISLNALFQFFDCWTSASLRGENGQIFLDDKYGAVDLENWIDLPEPALPKIGFATDYFFNEVEIGYPEIKNDVGALNGNEEFNCKFLFSLGATRKPAKLDKISRIKASSYEIEKIRTQTFQKATTDNKSDNDLYVLHVVPTEIAASGDIPAHYELDRTLNPTASGLFEPDTVFNIGLSPKRMLLNNGKFLRSSLYKCDSLVLKYCSADKNNKLIADNIQEKADVPFGSLDAPFFYPVIFDLTIPAPDNLLDLLDLNPLQVFRFPFYGNYYKGILVKASIAPSSKKAQNYVLLSTADNDLTQLSNYFG